MPGLSQWAIFALGSALFAGLTAFLGKMGVVSINSNLATFIRTMVIVVLLALILWWRQEWEQPRAITLKTWSCLILSGITAGLSWLCYFRALQLGPLSKVASVDKISVAFALMLGVLFLGEPWSWQVGLGAGLIVLGTILMIL